MNRKIVATLFCAIALSGTCQTKAMATDEWQDEPIRETLLLPVRGAAVGASLALTAPFEAISAGCRAVNSIMPEKTKDVELLSLVAAPAVFVGGALLGPIEHAPGHIEKSWAKPFSSESFDLSESSD